MHHWRPVRDSRPCYRRQTRTTMVSSTLLIKVRDNLHLDEGLMGHPQSSGFPVEGLDHPDWVIHVDPFLLVPGASGSRNASHRQESWIVHQSVRPPTQTRQSRSQCNTLRSKGRIDPADSRIQAGDWSCVRRSGLELRSPEVGQYMMKGDPGASPGSPSVLVARTGFEPVLPA